MQIEAWNALRDSLAVIDEAGTVLIVNRAWEEFGEQNGLQQGIGGVGTNYLAVCDGAAQRDDASARAAAAGIRGVLTGRLPAFELEYPCHSPEEERWFVLRATRYVEEGKAHAILMHENVTDRHQSQWEREMTAEYLQLINGCNGVRNLVEMTVRFFRRRSGCGAVGVRLKKGDDYPYYEARGFPEDFVEAENSLCTVCPDGRVERDAAGNPVLACMCGNVIAGRFDVSKPFFTQLGSFWTNSTTALLASTTDADRQARTRNRCNGEGYESVALLPLRLGREAIGLLQLNDKKKNRFSAAKVALWERLAGYLTVALAHARAEEDLKSSQAILEAAIDSTTDIVFIKDAQGRYTLVNSALCQMLGKKESDILGRTDQDLFTPEVAERLKKADQEVMVGKAPGWMEAKVDTPSGPRVFLDVKTLLWSGEGKVKGIFGIARDITERKAAEEALKKSEEKFAKAFHVCPEALGIATLEDGRQIEVNEALLRKVGLPREKVIGRTAKELGWWADPEARAQYVERLKKTGYVKGQEVALRGANGEVRHFLASGELIELDGQQCLLNYLYDNTERKAAEESLKKSEEKFAKAFQACNEPITIVSLTNGQYLEVNEAFLRTTGLRREAVIGHTATELGFWVNDDDRKRFVEALGKCGSVKGFGQRFRMPNGEIRDCEMSSEIIELDGKPCSLSYIFDITERKRAGEALKKSEEKFSKAFQACGESLVLVSMENGAILEANEAFLQKMGLSREEAIGHTTVELGFWREEDRSRFVKRLQAEGRVRNFEVQFKIPNGEIRDFLMSSEIAEVGGKRCSLSFLQDVTERKRAEELLKLRESYLASIIENQPGLIWLKDEHGRFLTVNDAFAHSCGMKSPEDLVGKTDLDVWPEDLARNYRADDAKVMAEKRSFTLEEPVFDQGQKKWFETFKTPVIDETGKVIGTTGYGRDISERKRAEEALRRSQADLANAQKMARIGSWRVELRDGREEWSGSDELCRIWGYPVGTPLTMLTGTDRMHPEDRARTLAIWQAAMEVGGPTEWELRIIVDGVMKWIHVRIEVERDEQGRPSVVSGTNQDITEAKAAEESLRKSEERFAKAFHMNPEPLMIVSLEDGKFVDVNEAFLEKWGLRREEAVGHTSVEMGMWTAREREPFVEKLIKDGAVRGYEVRMRLPGGKRGDFIISSETIELGGKPCSLGFILDITERKRAEEALRASEARLATALDGARLGMWEWDVKADRSVWNAAEYELLGLPVGDGEVPTDAFFARVHPKDVGGSRRSWRMCSRSGKNIE